MSSGGIISFTEDIIVMMKSQYILFAILLTVFFVGGGGFYPVARVNSDFVWAFNFNRNLAAAEKFYQVNQSRSVFGWQDLNPALRRNISMAVLQNLIEEKIILESGKNIPDFRSSFSLKARQISAEVEAEVLDQNIGAIYGWDMETFKKRIIDPEARREVLVGFISSQGWNFDQWFLKKKQEAKIRIFRSDLGWDAVQGRVVLK